MGEATQRWRLHAVCETSRSGAGGCCTHRVDAIARREELPGGGSAGIEEVEGDASGALHGAADSVDGEVAADASAGNPGAGFRVWQNKIAGTARDTRD